MKKADKFDKKILFELSKDSRQSDQKIAKAIKRSKQFVNYRIKKLTENKTIKSFQCRPSLNQLGLNALFTVFFKFKNVTKDIQDNINNHLLESKDIIQFANHIGVYDLSIAFVGKNLLHTKTILNQFLERFQEYITDYEAFFRYKIIAYPRKYLSDKKEFSPQIIYEEETKDLTKKEIEIIKELTKDPRINYIDLTKKLNININTLSEKIKKLKKSNTINSFSIHIDPKKTGFDHYMILLDIEILNKKDEEELIYFCNLSKEICFLALNIEKYHHMEIYVENDTNLQLFINRLRENFPKKLRDLTLIKVTEEPKEDFSAINRLIS